MRIQGGRVVMALTAIAALALTGCADDPDPKPSGPTEATPSPTDDFPAEDVADLIAGNPTDLVWRYDQADVPSSWTISATEEGEIQWHVAPDCLLHLSQPAGLGTEKSPTQDEVVDHYADLISGSSDVTFTERDSTFFPVDTGKEGITGTSRVSYGLFESATGAEGQIYAYRAGDFAVVAMTICGPGKFDDANAEHFQPFISELTIKATY